MINSICKKITFSSDNFLLKGTLHLPTVDRPPVVIGSHGLFSNSSSPKQTALARECNAIGIAFFRFDHRGCGKSEGDFNEVTSLKARCKDLICAIKTISARNDTGHRIGLFGSSMGGAVCISVASSHNIDAIVTFAAPLNSSSINKALKRSDYEKNFQFDISGKLSGVHNILMFHGDADTVVPHAHAKKIYDKASNPKKLIIQKSGDHRMSNKGHQERFIRESVNWFKNGFS
jgi:alpha-beta hydrolase superfamily lysophospholipase